MNSAYRARIRQCKKNTTKGKILRTKTRILRKKTKIAI